MKGIIVLVATLLLLALQFNFGLRKRKILGAIIPTIMAVLFIAISFLEKTTQYISTGFICVVALVAVCIIGYLKSAKYEKSELDKMKAKDIK